MQDFSSPLAQPFDFPEGDHGILLIHGFTGSPGHMRKIGDELHARGFAVRGIRLPGHAKSPKAMGRTTWRDWLSSAREAADDMREKYSHLTAAGLSMGGDLALILAQTIGLTACVTLAAPMKTTNILQPLSPLFAPFMPVIRKRPGGRETLDQRYDFGYDEYPSGKVRDLSVLMARARRDLPLVRCPILAVQSKKDQTISADSLDIILRRVSSPVKKSLWLEDSPHVVTISPEYMKIVDAMEAFLRGAERRA